jgi:hypothetical protein
MSAKGSLDAKPNHVAICVRTGPDTACGRGAIARTRCHDPVFNSTRDLVSGIGNSHDIDRTRMYLQSIGRRFVHTCKGVAAGFQNYLLHGLFAGYRYEWHPNAVA